MSKRERDRERERERKHLLELAEAALTGMAGESTLVAKQAVSPKMWLTNDGGWSSWGPWTRGDKWNIGGRVKPTKAVPTQSDFCRHGSFHAKPILLC